MRLNAPVHVNGDVQMVMESGNTAGSTMALPGPVSGSARITALNNGKGTLNKGTLLLSGDNSLFSGTWDLTSYSSKYPDIPGYISQIEGNSENAFGSGSIIAGHENRILISHARAGGDTLDITLEQSAKVVLSVAAYVSELKINGSAMGKGVYSAITNPEFFEGSGSISVGSTGRGPDLNTQKIDLYNNSIHLTASQSSIAVYNVLGHAMLQINNAREIRLDELDAGIYIIRYIVDGERGAVKFLK